MHGPVGCNQPIAASLTFRSAGEQADTTDPASMKRVVAISLESKQAQALAVVKAYVLFGLGTFLGLAGQGSSAQTAALAGLKQQLIHTEQGLKVRSSACARLRSFSPVSQACV